MFLTPLISAPVDIMIMLLGAFLIGFTLAWILRQQVIKQLAERGEKLQHEIRNLNIANENLDIAKDNLQEQLDQCLESTSSMVTVEELQQATVELKKERERSETARTSLFEIENAHEALKQELQLKIDQMLPQSEANKLRAEVNRLRMFNTTLEEDIRELKAEKEVNVTNSRPPINQSEEQPAKIPEAEFISSIGIATASFSDKNDLKKINGVGPFIEEKLHRLGIYTFDQIASMTPEQAEKINQAIEFFPGRILRDDWIGQAKGLIT
jgi:predicted flap endonuclease-1-like 5' DNA nuclease